MYVVITLNTQHNELQYFYFCTGICTCICNMNVPTVFFFGGYCNVTNQRLVQYRLLVLIFSAILCPVCNMLLVSIPEYCHLRKGALFMCHVFIVCFGTLAVVVLLNTSRLTYANFVKHVNSIFLNCF